jgi:YD repeat-containing protein
MKKLISIIVAGIMALLMTTAVSADSKYYDTQGRLIKENHVNGSDTSNYINYIYDENGNLATECINYFMSGNDVIKYHFYDENGLLVRTIYKDAYFGNSFISYEYDDNDLLVKDTEVDKNGNVNETYYEYDGLTLTAKTVYKYHGEITRTEYNETGVVIKEVITDGDWTNTYNYDEYGNLIEKFEEYNGTTEVIYTLENEYDEFGNLIKVTRHDNEYTDVHEYTYDEKGNCILDYEQNYKGSELLSFWHYKFTYDEKGNCLTELDEYYSAGELSPSYTYYQEFTYDENGNMIKRDHKSGGYVGSETNEYDALGNKIKNVSYNPDGTIHTYMFQYDENRNLRRERTTFSDSNNIRTIIYEYDERNELLMDTIEITQGNSNVEFYYYSSDEAEIFGYGDIDRDDAFGVADLVAVSKYVMGSNVLNMMSFYVADISRDGVVNSIDLALLKSLVVSG